MAWSNRAVAMRFEVVRWNSSGYTWTQSLHNKLCEVYPLGRGGGAWYGGHKRQCFVLHISYFTFHVSHFIFRASFFRDNLLHCIICTNNIATLGKPLVRESLTLVFRKESFTELDRKKHNCARLLACHAAVPSGHVCKIFGTLKSAPVET